MNTPKMVESELETRIAADYEGQGYKVVHQPGPETLPFDLGFYVPDLLVTKADNEHYIVEVKPSTSRIPVERYREVAKIVASQPGWRFLLVTDEGPLADQPGPRNRATLTWPQIQTRVEQAQQLRSMGEFEGSILALWSAFEALMRNRAEEIHLPLEYLQTSSVINHLYSQGELSVEQFEAAKKLRDIRNLITHGFQVDAAEEAFDLLDSLVREAIDEWRPT
ncbi:MAG: hypothetical protein KBG20_13100 [Caldilineaceae bacterium]|nr:hypothetical protein [Caldilineaceae bacterium]MBP8109479.1 hypothetical protein [Caldilineaceae bacterium]MBP8124216.1 hypothetical protein [Caldilineaceae bacterium]MBP9073234.1 hypothetical protein [Caldilineaceae bacterium]